MLTPMNMMEVPKSYESMKNEAHRFDFKILLCVFFSLSDAFLFGMLVRLKCQLNTDRYDENYFSVSLRHKKTNEH